MYQKINQLEQPGVVYSSSLLKEKVLKEDELKEFEKERTEALKKAYVDEFDEKTRERGLDHLEEEWRRYLMQTEYTERETGVDKDRLVNIAEQSINIDKKHKIHKTLERSFVLARQKKIKEMKENPDSKVRKKEKKNKF